MITNLLIGAMTATVIWFIQAITFGTVVGVVFPILTIIIGGACALLLSVTTTLRASNGDLRDRVTDLEAEQKIDKSLINSQKADLDALRKIVTGEVQLAAITDLLEHHHQAAVTAWQSVEGKIDQLAPSLDTILAEIKKDLRP